MCKMGEYAEYELERFINRGCGFKNSNDRQRRKTYQSGTGVYKWKNADGQVVSMWDMDVDYLINCVHKCREHNNYGKESDLLEVIKEKYPFVDINSI